MTRMRLPCAVLAILILGASTVRAELLSIGEDPTNPRPINDRLTVGGQCTVLWYGGSGSGEILRLQGLGLTITQTSNAADLDLVNLLNYNVLVICFTGPGMITAYQDDIELFVYMGNGLLIQQPNVAGVIDYAPTGFEVDIDDIFWCNGGTAYSATIVDGSHPITQGLVDDDLPGAFDLVGSIGPGYTVLAQNATCSDPSVAAGTYAFGRVAFEDGNGSPFAFDPGSDLFWTNLYAWLCTPGGPVSVESSSWGSVKAGYR